MEQALKALEQNGRPQLLLIAVLCVAAALLGLALLRDPAPAPADASVIAAVPESDRQARVETRLREQVEGIIGAIVGLDNVRAVVSAEIEPDQTRQVSEGSDPGTNSTETTTIRSSGQIRRLTVSILVDGHLSEGPEGVRYQPRTKAELARFTRLAQGAVGFDAMRGDSLTVETVRFAPAETAPALSGSLDALLPFARALLVGILTLAVLFLMLRMFRKYTPVVTPEPARAAEPLQPAAVAFTNDAPRSPALRRAGDAVAARPAAAAAIVRQWMSA